MHSKSHNTEVIIDEKADEVKAKYILLIFQNITQIVKSKLFFQ